MRTLNVLGTINLLFLSNVVFSRSGKTDVAIRNICLSFKNHMRVNAPSKTINFLAGCLFYRYHANIRIK